MSPSRWLRLSATRSASGSARASPSRCAGTAAPLGTGCTRVLPVYARRATRSRSDNRLLWGSTWKFLHSFCKVATSGGGASAVIIMMATAAPSHRGVQLECGIATGSCGCGDIRTLAVLPGLECNTGSHPPLVPPTARWRLQCSGHVTDTARTNVIAGTAVTGSYRRTCTGSLACDPQHDPRT